MKVSQLILTSFAVAVSSTAAVKVATGEQSNNGVNYAVVWKEGGEDLCRFNQLLAPTSENPCDRNFWIDNVNYHLAYCGTDNFGLYKADGSRVGGCTRVPDKKFSCIAPWHDVIKHWVCGN
ncbi:hypothetical protein Asppvi_005194 [Aspergillus pseudoviridinutans]|uniref:Small secreted protein n=1 Tax=Aspergillus pseudoviridinutans TaxID=1517512 RepID=A0A9P3B7T9_9EURO|nr:uncharacterized protein Asppvi_005194 [Aspergillus pseudoviridinutans]GIJ86307.1 hypothetical protein Asppvi_005194 [Aspergillus pseudoviridinutans]